MANVQKYTRAASGHLFKHYERARDESGEYLKFGNQDIDQARTTQNYNLGPDRQISQGEFVRQRCGEVKCLNRKDVNVMCAWVVTAPQTVAGNPDAEKKFFQESYDFLAARYGSDNVVSAYVHMDEKTPHMHFAFVPVVKDKKKEHLKVSAKECITKQELSVFHKDLESHMTKAFGYEIGVLNEATKDGNRSIEELKRGTAAETLAAVQGDIKQAEAEVKKLQQEKKRLQSDLKGLQGDIAALGDIQAVKPEKGLTGAVKGVTVEQIENLKKTAVQYHRIREKYQQQAGELEHYRGRAGVSMDERMTAAKTKQKLDRLEKAIQQEPPEVQQRIAAIVRQLERGRSRGPKRSGPELGL